MKKHFGQRLFVNFNKYTDFTPKMFFVFAIAIIALKLLLSSFQMIYISPGAAPIDDELLFEAAVSITNGQWLGPYNWLTLSKYPLFSVWLALLHVLNVPYLLGGQLLYVVACLCAVYATAPVLRSNFAKLLMLFVLVFNPVQTAAAVQLRVYRDNITNALALLLFAGFIGLALRAQLPAKKSLLSAVIAALGLAASFLNREDGAWFLVFCIPATIVTVFFIIKNKTILREKILVLFAQLIPYIILIVCSLVLSFVNLTYYGRFTVSDFTSAEFNDACGALMRVSMDESLEQIDTVPVSSAAIEAVGEAVPEFHDVAMHLQGEFILNNYGALQTGEYPAGGFYWALRNAVYDAGYADSAIEAQEYYENLAKTINTLCDSGELIGANNEISGTLMPFKIEYLPPVFLESAINLGRMLVYTECEPSFEKISIATPQEKIDYETFLLESANTSAQPYTDFAYYSPLQNIAYFAFNAIRIFIAAFMCVSFVFALIFQLKNVKIAMGATFASKEWENKIIWWAQAGLLLAVILRCLIVAYMFVTSFSNSVGRMPYLCAAQVALVMFCCNGAVLAIKEWRAKRA